MTRRGDRGSATLWVVAAIVLVVAVCTAAVLRTRAVIARHRAESAADLSALAAATAIGLAPDPCVPATRVARANRAAVLACVPELAPDGRSGSVRVRVACTMPIPVVGTRRVEATARAAREAAT